VRRPGFVATRAPRRGEGAADGDAGTHATPWRSRAFVSILSAGTVSQLGSQVSLIALPFVAIATLGGSTFEVAALGAVEAVPILLFGLPSGVWLDRVRRMPVMVVCDLGRAAAFASIPLAAAAGVLTIWQLYAVGFVTGALTVLFDLASVSILPTVLPRDDLPSANAALQVSGQLTQVAGPGLGGFIVGVLGAPYAVAADAASFVGSAALLAGARTAEVTAPDGERRSVGREIRSGLAYVIRSPILRPNFAFTSTANLFGSIFIGVFVLFAVRRLGFSARQVGLVFMLANIGSLAGAAATSRLQRRFGIGRVAMISAFSGWALLLVPFATLGLRTPLLVGGLLIWMAGAVIRNASSIAISQATTPRRLMARAAASRRLVAWGTVPLGTILAGVLGTYLGLRTTIFIGAGGRALAGLIVFWSPLRSVRTLEDAEALVASYNESFIGRDLTLVAAAEA
jgi:Transmembrane secretion effector